MNKLMDIQLITAFLSLSLIDVNNILSIILSSVSIILAIVTLVIKIVKALEDKKLSKEEIEDINNTIINIQEDINNMKK